MLPSTVFKVLLLVNLTFMGLVTLHYGHSLNDETRITTVQDFNGVFMPVIQDADFEDFIIESKSENELKGSDYTFIDPDAAYLILQKLDVYEPVADSYHNNYTLYNKSFLGLIRNDDYCDNHRRYFAENSKLLFEHVNYYTDFNPTSIMRKNVISVAGKDLHPEIGIHMPQTLQNQSTINLKHEINVFYSTSHIQNHLRMGQHYSCLSQASNDIPGRDRLNRKDYIAAAVTDYTKQYEDRPHCFNYDKFFPETWVLQNVTQCKEFFDKFNGQEYQQAKEERKIVYISKIGAGSHRAEGVQPVDEQEEQRLRKLYQNGSLCGRVKNNLIVQHYIANPLLLHGHKFDFRMYMVIASTNPVIAYYHDGFLRVSLHQYDVNSTDKGTLLTNTALSYSAFDLAKRNGTFAGMTETELKNFQIWSFARLQDHLLERGLITDQNWLNNYLRPEFKKAMIHLIRLTQEPFLVQSSIYELFGVDFMLDDNLNLWFIEANSNPMLVGGSEEKEKFVTQMLKDQLEIVVGLLRSRMKRVISYVNSLIEEEEAWMLSSDDVYISGLKSKKAKFAELIKNRFEPEFEPSSGNGFQKIIDENYGDVDRYLGLIGPECL